MYFSKKQLSEYSGFSMRRIHDLLKGPNPIPHFRVGRSIRVKREDFDSWLEQHYKVRTDLVDRILGEFMGIRKHHPRRESK
jgi:excisionase family DNA binding protein